MTAPARIRFQDVKATVKSRIHSGVWGQGTLLPTEQDLAEEFGCARATVNRALRELAEDGLIDRKRKSGTRVAVTPAKQAKLQIEVVRDTIEAMNATYRYALLSRKKVPAPDWLRGMWNVPAGSMALHITCAHYADTKPFQFEDRWIALSSVPAAQNEAFDTTGPNEWLLRQVPYTTADMAFLAASADSQTAPFFAVPSGTPLFQMERSTWLADAPVTFVRMTFHPQYRMQTRY